MNNVVPLRRVSFAASEASVVSPYKPIRAPRTDWRNSDTVYPRVANNVANIRKAPNVQKTATPRTAPRTPPAPSEAKISVGRRLIALAGVIAASVGVVAGLISIVALGPVGLTVAAGAAAVGAALIKFGTKQ